MAKPIKTSKRWQEGASVPTKERVEVPDAFKSDKPGELSVPSTPATPTEVVDPGSPGTDSLSELAEKAKAFSESLRGKASSAFEGLTSQDLTGLITGETTIEALVEQYGLTDASSYAEEMSAISQLANSINLKIAQKGVQVLALRDQRASFEVIEEAAKTATAATNTADQIEESEHVQKVSELRSQIRRQIELRRQADVTIQTAQTEKRQAKAGIAESMRKRREQRQEGGNNA